MSSLIAKLNKLAGQSPDQIAAQIAQHGWRRPRDLGADYFNANKEKPFVYCCVHAELRYGPTGASWVMQNCSPNYTQFCARLQNSNWTYWIIPLEEYTRGDKPPCEL